MTFPWPVVLLPSDGSPPELRNASRGGGATFTGTEQRIYSDAGRWEISYKIPIWNRAQQLAWRAMVARLREGEDMLVKVFDKARPAGADGIGQQALVAVNASARATIIRIFTINLKLEPGVKFSIGQRLYRINEVVAATPALSISDWLVTGAPWNDGGIWIDAPIAGAADYTVKISPPLRAAATALEVANFRDLVCLCVLPSDESNGDLNLDLGRFGEPSIKLIEA